MKIVLLLRHGAADWNNAQSADHDRLLNARGEAEAARVAALLAAHRPRPDCILCSTAERARATAEIMASVLPGRPSIEMRRRLYLAEPPACIGVLRECGDDAGTVLLVGHNPGLEHLVKLLTGKQITFSTGGLVRIDLPITNWSDMRETIHGVIVEI